MKSSTPAGTPRLRRTLTLWDLLFFGIVIVQPTAPLPAFGVVGQIAKGHVVTTLLIAMVGMMLTAVSYGRMAQVYPQAGSAYTFAGRTLNPYVGLLTGWSIVMDYLIGPTIGTIWCSKAAINILPLPYPVWVVFFAALFTIINLLGIRTTARTNIFLTTGMLAVVAIFLAAAARYVIRQHGVAGLFSTQPFYDPTTFSWPVVMTGTSVAVLTYMGFDCVSTLSEDVQNPRRNVLLATVLLCLITGVLGGLEVYFGQLVWPDFRTYPDPDTAFVAVAGRAGGPLLFQAMNATLLVATIGSSMGAQLGGVRLLYAMGRDDVIPRRFFGYLDPKRNTPRNNLLLTGGLMVIGALLLSYQMGAELLNFGAFIAFMSVNAACLTHYFIRGERTLRSVFTNLLPPLAGLLVCLYLWSSLRMVALVAGAAWLLVGVAYAAWKTGGFQRPLGWTELSDDAAS